MSKLVRTAIKHLLARGYAFTVWDSIEGDGEIDLRNSTDLGAIMGSLEGTESNKLVLKERTPEGFRAVGRLIFVYEFGEDDPLQDYAAADEEVEHDIREAFAYIV
jgi:hypothetical protein